MASTSDHLSSTSVGIDKNSLLTLPYPGGKVCVRGGHMTCRNQDLSLNDKGEVGRMRLSVSPKVPTNFNEFVPVGF